MKKLTLTSVSVLVLVLASFLNTVSAAPVPASNHGREYLINDNSLDRWSSGIFGSIGTRKLKAGGDFLDKLDFARGGVYVGYDIARWITPYVSIAPGGIKINDIDADTDVEIGFGVQLNLLDQEILDPNLAVDRVRVNANAAYKLNSTDWMSETYDWQELSVSLTGSIVNDIDGNKEFWPEGIAIYAGPSYSTYMGDLETDTDWGLILGVRTFFTKRVTLDLSFEKYSEEVFNGSLNVRF